MKHKKFRHKMNSQMNLHTGYKVIFATDLSVLRDSLLFEL